MIIDRDDPLYIGLREAMTTAIRWGNPDGIRTMLDALYLIYLMKFYGGHHEQDAAELADTVRDTIYGEAEAMAVESPETGAPDDAPARPSSPA